MTGTTAGKANAQSRVQATSRRRAGRRARRDLGRRVEKRLMSLSQARTARTARDATSSTRATPPAPLVLERYRLHRRLGAGAFGTVWMARDERLDRDVAVKILARERIVGGRFEREARAAARLAHPGIVTLYEAAVDDEGAYLVSELVVGATLDTLLLAGRLSDRDVVAIGMALCDALDHAHAQGVVHRDVKPSNVLVPDAPATATQLAKLTDFGVARVIGGDSLTLTGDVLGTLAYMAPEQAEGLAVGAPADLYSLALVIYEALTGVNPVRTGTAARGARRLGAHLPPLRRQRRDLPRELGQGIDQALRPQPRERGTIAQLRRALATARQHVSDEPGVVAGPLTTTHARVPDGPEADSAFPGRADALDEPRAGGRRALGADAEARADAGPAADAEASASRRDVWPARGLAAAGAAALTAWLLANLLVAEPLPPAAAAIIAGGATLLLPRLGWVGLTIGLCAGAAAQNRPGAALVILIAALLPIVLLAAKPTAWSLAAGAPALGLIGLAGAWPALAARAATSWRRAALGAIGWVWLLLAGSISGKTLYLPHIPGAPPAGVWAGSLDQTLHHLLATLVSTGVLVPAAVWALAAVVLPWLVGGRSPVLDVIRVVVWAAMLASATSIAVIAVHGSDRIGAAPSATLGALAAAGVALVPLALAAWQEALHSPGSGARVP
jgi:eukaryotic-like serine/threonine-protein kinase